MCSRFAYCRCFVYLILLTTNLAGAEGLQGKMVYQHAPKLIHDVLNSPASPIVVISLSRDRLLAIESLRQPPVSDLTAPMLRIGGLRINPATNGKHHPPRQNGLRVIAIPDGKETRVALPANAWISVPDWPADGRRFVFMNYLPNGIELWVADAVTAAVHKINGIVVNAAFGDPVQWMPDNRTLLIQTVVAGRGKPPEAPIVPNSPNVQESFGKVAPVPTFEDLLQNPHDEDLFDYYCTAQLGLVDSQSGKLTAVGKPTIFDRVDPSQDGAHLLIARLKNPTRT
jgi:dipeptidyl aminopeptidase/acylaminoacyl peptidase